MSDQKLDLIGMDLNSNLDTKALAKEFKANQNIQVDDFLNSDSAENLFFGLKEQVHWLFTYNDKSGIQLKRGQEITSLTPQ